MADYRELLRRAVDALPENTGANRRAVYEKARSALVAQLRAIDPPLPAREITAHRLNLEDCIREVEHEATEKLLGRLREVEEGQEPSEVEAAPVEPAAGDDRQVEPFVQDEPVEPPAPEPEAIPEPEAVTEPEVETESEAEIEPEVMREPEPGPVADVESDNEMADQGTAAGAPEWRDETESPSGAGTGEPEWEPEAVEAEHWPEPEPDPETGDAASAVYTGEPEAGEAEAPGVDVRDEAVEPEYVPVEPEAPRWDEPADEGLQDKPEAPAEDEAVSRASEETSASAYAAQQSIEDIIAQAQASGPDYSREGEEPVAGGQDEQPPPDETSHGDDRPKVVPFTTVPVPPAVEDNAASREDAHFIASPHEAEPRAAVPLVDLHGRPLGGAEAEQTRAPDDGQAMSSVREVDLDPGAGVTNHLSDAQVTIDRAIAALDREARGETTEGESTEHAGTAADNRPEEDSEEPQASESGSDDKPKGGGFGPLTVFLLIAILLLGGGGAAGFWAWREGYIDFDAVFAQGGTEQPTQVAEAEPDPEPAFTVEEEPRLPTTGSNTTEQVPLPDVSEPETQPENPVTETETPNVGGTEPELEFEERLPAEADEPTQADAPAQGQDIGIAAAGPQSLLLEEQTTGAAGAVPYTGSVEWSRGTDELGNPTIEASASIPARNLDVEVLLRRNADTNLPASHLMEINFSVAESFVGGSIANLPGVLLKNEELVQGRPLTGASARIVGNSFLFALSSASPQDVENNIQLLTEQSWLDLAMVYGTGRRAILTLEKGPEGQEIFDAVLADWAQLDAEAAQQQAPAENEAGTDAPA